MSYLLGVEFFVMEGRTFKIMANVIPLVMMVVGGFGSDSLKNKYVE